VLRVAVRIVGVSLIEHAADVWLFHVAPPMAIVATFCAKARGVDIRGIGPSGRRSRGSWEGMKTLLAWHDPPTGYLQAPAKKLIEELDVTEETLRQS